MSRFINGWVRIERRLMFEDIWERGSDYLAVWLRILTFANIEDSTSPCLFRNQPIKLKSGQLITGLRDLIGPNISLSTGQRILGYLQKTERIRVASGSQGTLITICNWDKYQNDFKEAGSERVANGYRAGNGREHIEQYNNITRTSENFFKNVDNSGDQCKGTVDPRTFEFYKRSLPKDKDTSTYSDARAKQLGISKGQLRELLQTWWPLL